MTSHETIQSQLRRGPEADWPTILDAVRDHARQYIAGIAQDGEQDLSTLDLWSECVDWLPLLFDGFSLRRDRREDAEHEWVTAALYAVTDAMGERSGDPQSIGEAIERYECAVSGTLVQYRRGREKAREDRDQEARVWAREKGVTW